MTHVVNYDVDGLEQDAVVRVTLVHACRNLRAREGRRACHENSIKQKQIKQYQTLYVVLEITEKKNEQNESDGKTHTHAAHNNKEETI